MAADTTAVYVYGIVPADVEPEPHATGVGDPPGEVTVVRHGDIAALVSTLSSDRPLGTPQDLTAHEKLLDGSAAVAPVLPLRFGAVMTDADAVEKELLEANEDEFHAALVELEGRVQFVIRGRYVEDAILRELLDENSDAARLRDEIRGKSEDATRNERIMLGEMINQAIETKRAEDTRKVASELEKLDAMVNLRDPTHEEDAVHLAALVETSRQDELEELLRRLMSEWDGRVELSLLGPMAAYDFVTKRAPEG
ncbi:GvpL/GvpF family gas vesicle protein [Nocardia africana]|uniref:Gas vesicle synthesis protein GvpL/GvpF n=1 Tax=Nocardia africana TaxID=134964 RepID=A0A378X4T0_9NOCA|nr:GvpL/GvpF family gas vesicle protein [Nocardia africana]MCC3317107.1 GvpL/GvpF family gas vesicle protein [Nocardia africana]SUA47835.1 Gas vesicle synthesis protein GvpL/GvpF [Nocardia africana]